MDNQSMDIEQAIALKSKVLSWLYGSGLLGSVVVSIADTNSKLQTAVLCLTLILGIMKGYYMIKNQGKSK